MANKKTSKELNEFIANQRKYWHDRALKEFEAGEKNALEVSNNLKSSYDRAIREIENKINSFYGKYAEKEGITLAEAKKLLDKKELKSFKSYLDEWIKDKSIRDKEKSELNLLRARTNVSRLEELKTGIKYELEKLTGQNVVEIEDLLTKTYNNAYKNTIKDISNFTGQGISFTSVDSNRVQKAISQQYLGSNYSKSIWNNEQRLLNTLEQDIPRGLILGYNPKKLAAQVSKDIGANYNNTVRLIRTEYAKVNNEATIQGYKNAGIKKYEILETPDHRTCDYCGELDGKVFNVSEAEAGYNMPPFHANCRGTTVAHFEDEDYEDVYEENNYRTFDIVNSEKDIEDYENLIKENRNNISDRVRKTIYGMDWDTKGTSNPYGYINSNWATDINFYLRNGHINEFSNITKEQQKEFDKTIKAMKTAIQSNKLKENITVRRFVDKEWLEDKIDARTYLRNAYKPSNENLQILADNLMKNKVIEENQFISTSLQTNAYDDRIIEIKINAKKGNNAFISENIWETEVIFDSPKLILDKAEVDNGKIIVYSHIE